MPRTLSQQEIDSIVAKAQKQSVAATATAPARVCHPWNAHEAGQLSNEYARSLSTLHEGFARNLTHSLGAYLNVAFGVTMISVEQYPFDEFLGSIPDLAYSAAFDMEPFGARGLLQMEHGLIFPVLEILLGGSCNDSQPPRNTSEIEDQIVESVCAVICAELKSAWSAVECSFVLGERQTVTKVERFLPGSERVIVLSFEVSVLSAKGTMNIVMPLSATNSILRKMAHDWVYQRPRSEPTAAARLKMALLACEFEAELGLPGISLTARDLLNLRPGKIIPLKLPIKTTAWLLMDKKRVFSASPVRSGNHRAAQLMEASAPRACVLKNREGKTC